MGTSAIHASGAGGTGVHNRSISYGQEEILRRGETLFRMTGYGKLEFNILEVPRISLGERVQFLTDRIASR